MKYLKEFATEAAYENYMSGNTVYLPNVSLTNDDDVVHFNKKPHDYSKDYFTIVALENGTISWSATNVQYSLNDGTWTNWNSSLAISADDKVRFKSTSNGDYDHITIGATGNIDVEGNTMSLLYGDNFVSQNSLGHGNEFKSLFEDNIHLINAGNLILPATTLSNYCYQGMFTYCDNLISAPVLPAEELTWSCYEDMFNYCPKLNSITCLATDISERNCTKNWLKSVSASGTFTKKAGTAWSTGVNGIPNGWSVVEV